ncbi:cellulase (plasmid) [Embleya sp. NBC_00888]|nr:cellulase [Embleya sp. NBC_00888]
MDDFEKELARMMRDTEKSTPFDSEHGTRLRAGVRGRRRARTAWAAGGAAAAIVALATGLLFLPGASADEDPAVPVPTAPPTSRPPTHAPPSATRPPSSPTTALPVTTPPIRSSSTTGAPIAGAPTTRPPGN